MKLEKTLFMGDSFEKKIIKKKLNYLPKDFSSPHDPKSIALLKNKEEDILLVFLEDVEIKIPEQAKFIKTKSNFGEIYQEFHYKDTNYFLKY